MVHKFNIISTSKLAFSLRVRKSNDIITDVTKCQIKIITLKSLIQFVISIGSSEVPYFN